MAVPLLDLKAQYASLRDEILRVTSEVYESQMFILGKRVEDFERDLAAYCGARHAIGLSSGTDALLIALMAYGIGHGDEVIVPAYSFFATAGVVDRVGARPVFVDIDLADYNIDPRAIAERITPRTRAIIPVHLYGQTADMEPINALARKHDLVVIEDAAQAIGARYRGKQAGTISPIGCFSFFPSKNLGAFGDAGAVTTDDDALADKLVDLRVHGMRPKYYHRYVGGNFRIDALQAAILRVKLPHLDRWAEGRRKNAQIYEELLAEAGERLVLPRELDGRHHVFNQYVIRFTGGRGVRDKVLSHLKTAGIGCEIYYPLTLPQQECFQQLPGAKEPYPNSETAAEGTLAIPIYPELTKDQMDEVVRGIMNGLEVSS